MSPFRRSAIFAFPRIPFCVFFVALLIRLWVLLAFWKSPHFGVQSGDMGFYHAWALRILQGVWTDHHAFYGLPGYAFVLAAVYKVFGVFPIVVCLIQAIIDSITASVVFTFSRDAIAFASKEPLSPRREKLANAGGIFASLGWVFFVPAQTFTTILMPTMWMICGFWVCVFILSRLRETDVLHPWAAFGLCIGVLATMIATVFFLLPLLLVGIVKTVDASRPWKTRAPKAALAAVVLFAGVFAGTSPVWIHNYFIAHEPVMLSAHSGINFWIGNYPGANGYPKIPDDLPAGQAALLDASIQKAEEAAGKPLTRAEVSHYWSGKAWTAIRQDPARWMRLLGTKLKNFWNAYQYDDVTIIALLKEEGVLFPGLGWGIVAAFGLAGMIPAWRLSPPSRWVVAAVFLHMFSLIPVFITERYRMAAAPGLLILGVVGISFGIEAVLERRWFAFARYISGACIAFAVVFLPKTDAPHSMELYNLGIAELEVRQLDRAERHLLEVQTLAPDSPPLLASLGELYQMKGNHEEARKYYQRALQHDSKNNQVLSNLGLMDIQEQKWEAAEEHLAAAVASEPSDLQSFYQLAIVRMKLGKTALALEAVEAALRLKPGLPPLLELRRKLTASPEH